MLTPWEKRLVPRFCINPFWGTCFFEILLLGESGSWTPLDERTKTGLEAVERVHECLSNTGSITLDHPYILIESEVR
jgi:hypothetical protein